MHELLSNMYSIQEMTSTMHAHEQEKKNDLHMVMIKNVENRKGS